MKEIKEIFDRTIEMQWSVYKALVITGAIVAAMMLTTMIMHRCATVNIQQQNEKQHVQKTKIPSDTARSKY